MKILLLTIGANMVSLACIVGAVVMALNNVSGWGWLIFAGVITSASVDYKSKGSNNNESEG